jgi:hypothetical protein
MRHLNATAGRSLAPPFRESSPSRRRAESRLCLKFASSASGAFVEAPSASVDNREGSLGIECSPFLEVRQEPLDFFIFLQAFEALRHIFVGKFLFSVGHGFGVMHSVLHSAER